MKKVTLGIFIVSLSIAIVFFSGLLLNSVKKPLKFDNIADVADQVMMCVVEPLYLVERIPERSEDEYQFAGKTYKMYCQFARNYAGYNDYLASHGCTVTTLTAILRAYAPECENWTPYETITIAEKEAAGDERFDANYSKSPKKQMPFTFLAATQILDRYGIEHEYEPYFESDEALKEDILQHLHTGKPVMFVISQKNRATNKKSRKWTMSYHTMLMIGTDGQGNVLMGNPAGSQRLQLVSLDEMVNYMWSCTDEPDGFYWNGESRCGGYIKIME